MDVCGMIFLALLPIILVHGYSENASIWNSWVSWMHQDHINNVQTVTFPHNDQCGTASEHAMELKKIIGNRTVDVVAHSMGGLEARLLNSAHIKNLIMIATPNEGTEAAYTDLTPCGNSTSTEDLQPGSDIVQTPDADSSNTHYFAIAGNSSDPCLFIEMFRYICYDIPNDGLVTVDSALSHYQSLGVFPYNHEGLLAHREIYEKVMPTILSSER